LKSPQGVYANFQRWEQKNWQI